MTFGLVRLGCRRFSRVSPGSTIRCQCFSDACFSRTYFGAHLSGLGQRCWHFSQLRYGGGLLAQSSRFFLVLRLEGSSLVGQRILDQNGAHKATNTMINGPCRCVLTTLVM